MDSKTHNILHSLIWAVVAIIAIGGMWVTICATTHDNNETQVKLKEIK
ncbi:MAG TPA: hypothetical protein VN081_00950 [Dongiaceae bacterium]|nr:hypothetical protein [Dongiaceae bacterium]